MPSHCPEICSVIFPHFCFTSSCFFSLLLSQSGGGESGRFRVVAAINLVERLRLDLGADRRTSGEGFGLGYRRENHQVLFFFHFFLLFLLFLLSLFSRPLLPPAPLLQRLKSMRGSPVSLESPRSFSSSSGAAAAAVPFLLADIGEGIAEVELLQWFVEAGDEVKQFDRICEVQSDKATVEITSRYDGVVESLNGDVGDMMIVGEPLLMIGVEGGDQPEAKVTTEKPGEMANKLSVPQSPPAVESEQDVVAHGARSRSGPADAGGAAKVLTTPAVRKIARENGIDLTTVAGSGNKGRVLKEDILAVLTHGKSAAPEKNSGTRGASTVPVSTSPPARASGGGGSGGEDRREPVRGYARLMVQSMRESLKVRARRGGAFFVIGSMLLGTDGRNTCA